MKISIFCAAGMLVAVLLGMPIQAANVPAWCAKSDATLDNAHCGGRLSRQDPYHVPDYSWQDLFCTLNPLNKAWHVLLQSCYSISNSHSHNLS